MPSQQTLNSRRAMERLFLATVARLNPAERTATILAEADWRPEKTILIAIGKSSLAMASGAVSHLSEHGLSLESGVVVVPESIAQATAAGRAGALAGLPQVVVGGHPVPDQGSVLAAQAALAAVTQASANAEVLVLLSGGASALAALPAPGLSLADKNAVVSAVSASGAARRTVNMVRKHLSAIKGGRLAQQSPVRIATLVASDVVGDDLTAVGGGPTLPDRSTWREACDIVAATVGWGALPWRVRAHFQAGLAGEQPDTPKEPRPGDRVALVAGTGALVEAGLDVARDAGFEAKLFARDIADSAQVVAGRIAAQARRLAMAGASRRLCFVGAGEPSISVPPNPGIGGRAQHIALLVARELAGIGGVTVLVAASDGIDGNSSAAGAVIDGNTWDSLLNAGLDPEHGLRSFSSGELLHAIGATMITGISEIKHGNLVLIATGV